MIDGKGSMSWLSLRMAMKSMELGHKVIFVDCEMDADKALASFERHFAEMEKPDERGDKRESI